MRWLRRQSDVVGLVAVWGLLLQALVVPLSSGLHAATLAPGASNAPFICGIATPTSPPASQKDHNRGGDCQACHAACGHGCGSMCGGGLLPAAARVVLPLSNGPLATAPDHSSVPQGLHAEALPRAPPWAAPS